MNNVVTSKLINVKSILLKILLFEEDLLMKCMVYHP